MQFSYRFSSTEFFAHLVSHSFLRKCSCMWQVELISSLWSSFAHHSSGCLHPLWRCGRIFAINLLHLRVYLSSRYGCIDLSRIGLTYRRRICSAGKFFLIHGYEDAVSRLHTQSKLVIPATCALNMRPTEVNVNL